MIIKINEKQLNKYFEIDDSNKMMADFIITYINEAKNINNKNLYEGMIEYFELDKNILNVFNKNHNFKNNIVKLDVNEYINNPYNKQIKVDKIIDEDIKFEYLSFKPFEGFLCDEINVTDSYYEQTKIGYFDLEYKYLTISKNNEIWMLLSPHEINTMKNAINKAFGNVITFGLGLGYFAYMCSIKEDVNTVTIIEKDDKIIDLFNKHILPLFENKEKIKIIKEDALTYLDNKVFTYDYAFIDLWHDTEDGLKLYIDCYNKAIKHTNTTFDYWIEKSMLIMIRRCLITILYESLNNIEYNQIENYYDYLINRLKEILKDHQINNSNDVNRLLSDENIKNLITKI